MMKIKYFLLFVFLMSANMIWAQGASFSRNKSKENTTSKTTPKKNQPRESPKKSNFKKIPSSSITRASGSINGYDYVDLGLSVKWATCNVGATSPVDYGDYYAWGETTTKSTYD